MWQSFTLSKNIQPIAPHSPNSSKICELVSSVKAYLTLAENTPPIGGVLDDCG